MSNPKSPKPLATNNPTASNGSNFSGTKKAPPATAKQTAAAPTADTSAATTAENDVVKAVEKLEIRTKAVNSNSVARVANSWLNSNDERLHTLYSLKTGKPLEKFPPSSREISKLSCEFDPNVMGGLLVLSALLMTGAVPTVDLMLNNLDADRSGSEEAKKERLRMQLGLRPTPA